MPKGNKELTMTSVPNWCDENGRPYMKKCPECATENYAMNVATGSCYSCGYQLPSIDPIDVKYR